VNKLNILQINSSKVLGGGEIYLQQLTEGLINQKHNLTLVIRNEISNYFSNFNAEIEILPLKNVLDFISFFRLVKIIKDKEIDIIHVHTGKDYWLGTIARNLAGRGKVVATRHILTPLGKSYLHRKLYSSIDKFIAVSSSVKDILVEENRLPSNKIEVIYNGVNIEKFNSNNIDSQSLKENLDINNKGVIIGTIGRLAEEKNQKLLVKAIGKLKDKISSDFKCLIVGEDNSSEQKYKAEIEELIFDLNLKKEVFSQVFKKIFPQY
jgi:glycosyltransferase involved in cell wall biosynthesis